MKLLLTSGGLTNDSIVSTLADLLEMPFTDTSIAFIPTAANMESGDKWWLLDDLDHLRGLHPLSIDLVDISALPRSIWQKRLEESDVLLFEGGNTFHLNYWIHESGLARLLPRFLESKVYVGISAGTIVATPSLILSTAEKEPLEEIEEHVIEEGLGLVDFLVEPHINNLHFPENTFEQVETAVKDSPHTVYALDDNSAIKVTDDIIEVISEGEWKKFH
ncbi:Type 1 glutamine amidotransferase-like domain-containing protein, partial [Candidatus Roizmanbacteria bacterium]|nr:Type 1 glutamine amidotransferase-like domain-containing protein [Candidatus Roizmanbacteria bacterium]